MDPPFWSVGLAEVVLGVADHLDHPDARDQAAVLRRIRIRIMSIEHSRKRDSTTELFEEKVTKEDLGMRAAAEDDGEEWDEDDSIELLRFRHPEMVRCPLLPTCGTCGTQYQIYTNLMCRSVSNLARITKQRRSGGHLLR